MCYERDDWSAEAKGSRGETRELRKLSDIQGALNKYLNDWATAISFPTPPPPALSLSYHHLLSEPLYAFQISPPDLLSCQKSMASLLKSQRYARHWEYSWETANPCPHKASTSSGESVNKETD